MGKLGARADQESLADLVYACVAHVDPDVRKELLGNIQIVGGGALVQGLSNRLNYELNNIVPTHMKVFKGLHHNRIPFHEISRAFSTASVRAWSSHC
jgi:actin-related protein